MYELKFIPKKIKEIDMSSTYDIEIKLLKTITYLYRI